MRTLIASAWVGAWDLYNGIPDLDDAKFIGTVCGNSSRYETILKFELKSGEEFHIRISPREQV